MDTPKRQIKPHKGGRDEVLKVRLTKAEKTLFDLSAADCDMTQADFVMYCVRFYISSKHYATRKAPKEE